MPSGKYSNFLLQEKMQIDLATLIYATGAPLSMVENSLWMKFWKKWKPSFKPPNRHQISNNLLESVYAETQITAKEKVSSARAVALVCDGWSNVR